MRLSYFLAVIIAVFLHASSKALSTKESNHDAILASTDHDRLLRRVEKDDAEELENELNEEERILDRVALALRTIDKRIPGTEAFKNQRLIEKGKAAAKRFMKNNNMKNNKK